MEIGLFCKVIFDIVNHLQNRISMKRTISIIILLMSFLSNLWSQGYDNLWKRSITRNGTTSRVHRSAYLLKFRSVLLKRTLMVTSWLPHSAEPAWNMTFPPTPSPNG